MGREWDKKRRIDELLNANNNLTPEMKKDLEAEREKLIKIQLNESKLETGAIGYLVLKICIVS